MLSEALTLAWVCLAGGALGAMFFGGLWWTVRKGVSAKQPAVWFLGSLLLRTSIAMVGMYLLSRHHAARLPPCLLGFALASFVVLRITRPSVESRTNSVSGARHAP
jgi:F1F0 ATPase subunit 2